MKEKILFQERLEAALREIGEETLQYDESEYWMIRQPYEYIALYAREREFFNTAVALPLSRGLHNGSHRKSGVTREGVSYKLPYVIHCLLVCRMLVDMHLPLSPEEEDIVLASALCHDMIEDMSFQNGGRELYTQYHLDPRIYEVVKRVSKRRDFTEEEERAHFHGIEEDPFALLVKLSDRGNNVEDLYNMSIWKIHEYVGETRKYFYPMCEYGKQHYPQLYISFEILQDKILLLTHTAEILVDSYTQMEKDLLGQIKAEREENERLRRQLGWQ